MQSTGDYYQRAPRCCPAGRTATSSNDASLRITSTVRGAEWLCCCCTCSTSSTSEAPGLLACLGVCVLVVGYTLLGAFAFMALEGGLKSEPPTEVITSGGKPGGTYMIPNLEDDAAAVELRARTVEKLWSITEDLNVLYKENWTRLAAREVLEFQESLTRGLKRSSSIYDTTAPMPPPRREHPLDRRLPGRRWTFSSSLLYSVTLITTIGCGSVTPRTVWGRVITIVYALAGIPLMLVYLSTVGDVLARSFQRLYRRICRPRNCARKQHPPPPPPPVAGIIGKAYRYDNHVESKSSSNFYTASKESSCDDLGTRGTGSGTLLDCGSEGLLQATTSSTTALQESGCGKRHFQACSLPLSSSSSSAGCTLDGRSEARIPISLCLTIILLYLCGGSLMFNRLEGWSLADGCYFCFTCLGTIGFGDLMPVGKNAPTSTLEELSVFACSLYILVGMGLIAMCFNLMQEEVDPEARSATRESSREEPKTPSGSRSRNKKRPSRCPSSRCPDSSPPGAPAMGNSWHTLQIAR